MVRFCTPGRRLVPGKVVAGGKEMMDLIFDWSGQCVENNRLMAGNALFTERGEDGDKRPFTPGARADVGNTMRRIQASA